MNPYSQQPPEYTTGYQQQQYVPNNQPHYPQNPQNFPQNGQMYPPQQPYYPQQPLYYPPQQQMMMPPQQMYTNVNVNVGYQKPQQISFLIRVIYFCFIGWWLGMMWIGIALALMATVIFMPIGIMMLNRTGAVMTLRV